MTLKLKLKGASSFSELCQVSVDSQDHLMKCHIIVNGVLFLKPLKKQVKAIKLASKVIDGPNAPVFNCINIVILIVCSRKLFFFG